MTYKTVFFTLIALFVFTTVPTYAAVEWVNRTSNTVPVSYHFWASIAKSSDGTKIVAVENGNNQSGDIWTSADSGASWTNRTAGTAATAKGWMSVTSSPDGIKLAAAANNSGNVWTSTDSGVTWTDATSGTAAENLSFAAITSSNNGDVIIAGTEYGDIWISVDGGDTWDNKTTGTAASGAYWSSIATDLTGTNIIASEILNGDIWISTDSGANWTDVTAGTPAGAQYVSAVTISADGTKMAFAVGDIATQGSSQGDIWISTDSGANWNNVTTGTAAEMHTWTSLVSSSDGTKFVATENDSDTVNGGGNIWTSTDSGATWTNRTDGTAAESRYWRTITPSAGDNVLYVAETSHVSSRPGDIWKSVDQGVTWNKITEKNPPATNSYWTSITSSADGINLFAVDITFNLGDIWKSADSGATWINKTTGTSAEKQLWRSVSTSADGQKIIAGSDEVWISSDGGDTWTMSFDSTTWIERVKISGDGDTLIAAEANSRDVQISTDGGSNWINRTTGTGLTNGYYNGIASSYDGIKIAIAEATGGFGDIWTSTDRGLSWTNRTTGTAATDQAWRDIDSSNDGVNLVAVEVTGGTGDIWTSTDSGITWTNRTTGTSATNKNWKDVDSSDDGSIIAAVVNNGDIWLSIDSGITWTNTTTGTDAASKYWSSVTSSSNGTKLAATETSTTAYGGDIWTYTSESASLTNTGGFGTIFVNTASINALNTSWWTDYALRNGLVTSTSTASTTSESLVASSTQTTTLTTCRPGDFFDMKTGVRCPSMTSQASPLPTNTIFTKDLFFNMTDPEVRLLQQFLNAKGFTVSNSGAGSLGNETMYFGSATRAAVIRFQKANSIAPAVGYFGPKTREVVNTLESLKVI